MARAFTLLASAAAIPFTLALHPFIDRQPQSGSGASLQCVSPGICTPPATTFSRVITGPVPGQQWNIAGGFCGAFSLQHAALAFGAWVSQDLVRKANRDQTGIEHNSAYFNAASRRSHCYSAARQPSQPPQPLLLRRPPAAQR